MPTWWTTSSDVLVHLELLKKGENTLPYYFIKLVNDTVNV